MEPIALQTVTGALTLGAASSVLARRFRIPAVLFYLLSGLAAGPIGLGLLQVDSLGTGLLTLVEIAVAIILFEGGLSLSSHHFFSESDAIRRILIITIPLTGGGAAALSHFLLDLPWPFAIFFGAIIVVTGPTVIGSLLKNINLSRRLEILLNWESIWGDVLGVLLSAVALEMIRLHDSGGMAQMALNFALRLTGGTLLGAICGYLLAKVILPWLDRLRDPALPGLVAVAAALATFALANLLLESSGPLAAAVAGFTLSTLAPDILHELRHFKEQLSTLFIATLFVLLSAYLNPLAAAGDWPRMLLIALALGALVRPLAIALALLGTKVNWPERLFIGFIGPRGIIALATVAYASLLIQGHERETRLLLNLTFAIIFFSGLSATVLCRPLARLLKVQVPVSGSGLLIAGVNALSSEIARFAQQYVPVVVLDGKTTACSIASILGHRTSCVDILDSDIYAEAAEEGFGRLLIVTGGEAMNELIAQKAAIHMQPDEIYRVTTGSDDESLIQPTSYSTRIAFADGFQSREIIRRLESGEARLELLPSPLPTDQPVIPLIEVVDNGKGLCILAPGRKPAAGNPVYCFVPGGADIATG